MSGDLLGKDREEKCKMTFGELIDKKGAIFQGKLRIKAPLYV